jgi:hypothetical protein
VSAIDDGRNDVGAAATFGLGLAIKPLSMDAVVRSAIAVELSNSLVTARPANTSTNHLLMLLIRDRRNAGPYTRNTTGANLIQVPHPTRDARK